MNVHSSIIHNHQKVERIQMFINWGMDKPMWPIHTVELVHGKESSADTCYSLGGPWKHYGEMWLKKNTSGNGERREKVRSRKAHHEVEPGREPTVGTRLLPGMQGHWSILRFPLLIRQVSLAIIHCNIVLYEIFGLYPQFLAHSSSNAWNLYVLRVINVSFMLMRWLLEPC